MSQKRIVNRLLKVDPNVEVSATETGVHVRLSAITSVALQTVSGIAEITELELGGDFDADDESIASLRHLTNLKRLGIHCRSSSRFLSLIPQMPWIVSLTIAVRGEPVIDAFNTLKRCSQMQSVQVWVESGSAIDNQCIQCLTEMKELRKLDLHDCTVTVDFGILQHLKSFEEVDVSNDRIELQALNSISKCKSLTKLDVSFTICGDETIGHLASCQSLRVLNCRRTQLSESAVELFVRFPNLQDLWTDVSIVSKSNVALFGQCKALKRLTLFGTNMDRKLERQLRTTLPECEIRLFLSNRKGCC